MKPLVFVSYAEQEKADRALGRQIIEQLREAGANVFDLESDIYPGDNWGLKVGNALRQAQDFIIVLSPRALESPRLQHEVGVAITTLRFKDHFFPVLARAIPEGQRPPWLRVVPSWGPSESTVRRLVEEIAHRVSRRAS